MYFYLYVFNKYNFCNFYKFFAYVLNTSLIAAREKFQILKNGSFYQGAWPPLNYEIPHYKPSSLHSQPFWTQIFVSFKYPDSFSCWANALLLYLSIFQEHLIVLFFFERPTSSPPGYLWHNAHTPGSFSVPCTNSLFQNNSYQFVYGLTRLQTTNITIN